MASNGLRSEPGGERSETLGEDLSQPMTSGNLNTNQYIPYWPGDFSGGSCPNCGYCRYCGRGGHYKPYPFITW